MRAFSSAQKASACAAAIPSRGRDVAARSHRRDVLLAGTGAAIGSSLLSASDAQAAETMEMSINMLSTFERSDQRQEVLSRTKNEVLQYLTVADSPKCLRLMFNDAATYDYATNTGGMDGSVVLNKEERNREENKGLGDVISKLEKVKKAVDNGNKQLGSGPISWADLIVIAAKTTTERVWIDLKIGRAARPENAESFVRAFGSPWEVRMGRVDCDGSTPNANRALRPGAGAEEVKAFMNKLNQKEGPRGFFDPKPTFWERPTFVLYPAMQDDPIAYEDKLASEDKQFAAFKKKYDIARETITRTDYEVDFISYFTDLSKLGAKFNSDAYLHPVTTFRLQ